VEDLTKHKMDAERIIITEETAEKVNKAREEKHQICAVGTTVIRTLESSVSTQGYLKACDDWTNKFIFPPHQFSVPTSMVTNFHLPYSTALMTAAAFGGFDFVMEAYHSAVKENYRFGAYGDAMLII
jgi:S-adenosylmethionine:tRNA ribosyltransferase-isomerase